MDKHPKDGAYKSIMQVSYLLSSEISAENLQDDTLYIGVENTQNPQLMGVNFDPQHGENPANVSCLKYIVFDMYTAKQLIFLMADEKEKVVLVTTRLDLDSVLSMGVLTDVLLNAGVDYTPPEALERVNQVDTSDCFIKGKWQPGFLDKSPVHNVQLAAIASFISDRNVSLEEKVKTAFTWLLTGQEPEGYREKYEKDCEEIIFHLENGKTVVTLVLRDENDEEVWWKLPVNNSDDTVLKDGKGFAIVKSTLRAATSVGYDRAPVVMCYNPKFQGNNWVGLKYTIAQCEPGWIDLVGLKTELLKLEEGWGGSSTILGSPQTAPSSLDVATLTKLVRKYML